MKIIFDTKINEKYKMSNETYIIILTLHKSVKDVIFLNSYVIFAGIRQVTFAL